MLVENATLPWGQSWEWTVESRYPEVIYKRHCLHPPGYLVQRHLCFVETVSLLLEAKKEFLAEINLLRFYYTWLNGINLTEIEALCQDQPKKHFWSKINIPTQMKLHISFYEQICIASNRKELDF